MKNTELRTKPRLMFNDSSYSPLIIGVGIIILISTFFTYMWVYEKDSINVLGASFVYTFCLILSIAIIFSYESRVLELDNTTRILTYTTSGLLGFGPRSFALVKYQDVFNVSLCQKMRGREHSLDISYYLKLNTTEQAIRFKEIRLFKSTSLYHVKKHYYLLNYLMDKEMVPDDARIPIELTTVTEAGKKVDVI